MWQEIVSIVINHSTALKNYHCSSLVGKENSIEIPPSHLLQHLLPGASCRLPTRKRLRRKIWSTGERKNTIGLIKTLNSYCCFLFELSICRRLIALPWTAFTPHSTRELFRTVEFSRSTLNNFTCSNFLLNPKSFPDQHIWSVSPRKPRFWLRRLPSCDGHSKSSGAAYLSSVSLKESESTKNCP